MNYNELQNQPKGTYLIIEHKERTFKYYPEQISAEFWEFLTAEATITYKANNREKTEHDGEA